jgi:hypothetical protein
LATVLDEHDGDDVARLELLQEHDIPICRGCSSCGRQKNGEDGLFHAPTSPSKANG